MNSARIIYLSETLLVMIQTRVKIVDNFFSYFFEKSWFAVFTFRFTSNFACQFCPTNVKRVFFIYKSLDLKNLFDLKTDRQTFQNLFEKPKNVPNRGCSWRIERNQSLCFSLCINQMFQKLKTYCKKILNFKWLIEKLPNFDYFKKISGSISQALSVVR